MKIELLHDDYPNLRVMRIGNWLFTHDYETGQGEWDFVPKSSPAPEAAKFVKDFLTRKEAAFELLL